MNEGSLATHITQLYELRCKDAHALYFRSAEGTRGKKWWHILKWNAPQHEKETQYIACMDRLEEIMLMRKMNSIKGWMSLLLEHIE